VVGTKVVGTIEGLYYKEEIWKPMSKEQKEKVVEPCKAKSTGRTVKAATTTTAGTVPMDVSDQLQMLDSCCSVSGFQQRWWTPVDGPSHKLPPMRGSLPV
jgi:hypothetical protein